MYHSPKYWKEMARARKEHEAKVRFAKDQASSDKPQASSAKLLKKQATSIKRQALRFKRQAASNKLLHLGHWKKFHGPVSLVLN